MGEICLVFWRWKILFSFCRVIHQDGSKNYIFYQTPHSSQYHPILIPAPTNQLFISRFITPHTVCQPSCSSPPWSWPSQGYISGTPWRFGCMSSLNLLSHVLLFILWIKYLAAVVVIISIILSPKNDSLCTAFQICEESKCAMGCSIKFHAARDCIWSVVAWLREQSFMKNMFARNQLN